MKSEFDLHGVGVGRTRDGRLRAGPLYCPIYYIKGTEDSKAPDKVLIDDDAFTADHENDAAVIAIKRKTDTLLNDLVWSRKVGVVTIKGLLSYRAKHQFFTVLYFAGPTFDAQRRQDDQVAAARRAAGLPTGLPGDRKIIVTNRMSL